MHTSDGPTDEILMASPSGTLLSNGPIISDLLLPAIASQIPAPNPLYLIWNVAELAQARGIPNASALAAHMGVSRQGVYPIWKGDSLHASLTTLGLLARALDVAPGDWFGWREVIDLGDITSARGVEMYLPLWLRMWGAVQAPMFNIKLVR
ncbi:MAG: helix-turn-helix transcriptional regulator [Oscillochloris sp.]|nr:helix-turn-helix transcriptional regulator [Oscillochloris sp.]